MIFQLFDNRVRRVTDRIAVLADSGFYNGVIFHRIINDFVNQGGDPTGTGTGGSPLGNFDDRFHVDLQHNRTRLLSMAKNGDDSNNSQFFITEGAPRHLDFEHSIFGLLVEGETVRQQISDVPVDGSDRPVADVVMGSVQTFRVNVTPDTVNTPPLLVGHDGPFELDASVTAGVKSVDVHAPLFTCTPHRPYAVCRSQPASLSITSPHSASAICRKRSTTTGSNWVPLPSCSRRTASSNGRPLR